MNGNEDSITGFAIEAAKRTSLVEQYVIMGGKSKGAGWATSDDKDLLQWIAWAKATYPIDPRRVHIIGMSNGGWMVKRFGWEHQDLFASVTPYCGGGVDFSGVPKGEKAVPKVGPMSPAETRTEWYFVHGDADEQVGVDASRKAVAQLKEKGYRYIYREIIGANHGGILQFPEVADDALRFMHALRHKEIPIAKDEKTELSSMLSKVKTEKGDAMTPFLAETQRIGGAPGARVLNGALENPDPDVKKSAVETTEKTTYGREVVLELIKLLKDKSDDVKNEAFKALAFASNWRYPEAQETLVRLAKSKSTPAADRTLAIEGLGKTVKLQFLGNFEDKHVIWTLVNLLDDDDQKVRETAFAQVEKLVKDTFQYKPDLPPTERKASFAKWKQWISTKCGTFEALMAGK
jgi:predicted esterase